MSSFLLYWIFKLTCTVAVNINNSETLQKLCRS